MSETLPAWGSSLLAGRQMESCDGLRFTGGWRGKSIPQCPRFLHRGAVSFTKIDSDDFSQGGRAISVSVRNWSDTTTFLLEAEVVHPMVSDMVRESYPVIFGPALNFTLPSTAEGPSIEAEINGETIIFPLGPDLFLSWVNCNVRGNQDQTRAYRL